MSQSHGIKGVTTDEAFQEWHFLLESRASVGANFDLFSTFKNFYMHKNVFNTLKKSEKKTHTSPLTYSKRKVSLVCFQRDFNHFHQSFSANV